MRIKQLEKNKYQVTIEIGSDYKGKRKRVSKILYASSKRDLNKQIKEFEDELPKRTSNNNMTVSDLLDEVWNHIIQGKSPNTIRGYDVSKRRIESYLGKMKTSSLSPRYLQEWINEMDKDNYSPKTIKDTYSVLRLACTVAVSWDIINKNPCHDIKIPKKDKKEIRILNSEEFTTFCSNLNKLDLDTKVLIELALFGGLRRGEIMGIKNNDIPDNGIFFLDHARYHNPGNDFVKEVKTPSGKRRCAIPDFVVDDINELKEFHSEQKEKYGELWRDSDYLIKMIDGRAFSPNEANRRLHQYMKSINLEPVTFHALRHTYASIVVASGADLATISRRMGHSNINTTLGIYTHMFNKDKESDPIANYINEMVNEIN